MDRQYHETNNLLQKVQIDLARFETCNNEQTAQAIVQIIYADLRTLEENGKLLDDYVSREQPAKRQMARMQVNQLKSDIHRVQMAATSLHNRMTQKWRADSERNELLTQRFRPNETSLTIGDHELQMNDRLHQSNSHLDDLISQGSAVLENLKSQHLNLRGVRRRMLDVGQALGLSNSTLQVIDRRVREDWFIFVIGCVICCLFMYIFYRFWKS